MSVQGVICREVDDLRLAMRSIVSYDPHDPWQVPIPLEWSDTDTANIGFTRETYQYDADPAVLKALDAAAACLIDAGHNVVEIKTPDIQEIGETGLRALMKEVEIFLAEDIQRHGSPEFKQIFANYLELFPPFSNEDFIAQLARRSHFVREWNLLFEQYPLILTPFLPNKIPSWNRDSEGTDGVTGFWSFSMNYLGLPAGVICPILHEDMPVAVQIVGRRFSEDLILKTLEAIEERSGIMAYQLFEKSKTELGWQR